MLTDSAQDGHSYSDSLNNEPYSADVSVSLFKL